MWAVIHDDALRALKTIDDNQFDSIVTDPPYGLEFMGKEWDKYTPGQFQNWCEQWARECLRVLKPGGYLAAFGGTRTYHRLAAGIEDAGFEIRDSLHWIYGSGFPKSRDISKAIDSEAGAVREVVGKSKRHVSGKPEQRTEGLTGSSTFAESIGMGMYETAPATEAAKQWNGWGTALKPSHEPIILARKPLSPKHTVAANVLEFGTGAINVDGCRVGDGSDVPVFTLAGRNSLGIYGNGLQGNNRTGEMANQGRWPPNILLGHSPWCEQIGTKRVKGSRIEKPAEAIENHNRDVYSGGSMAAARPARGYGDAEGMETVEVWNCAEDCPVAEMDRQSGSSQSRSSAGRQTPKNGTVALGNFAGTDKTAGHDDAGGASRFFPVFRYNAKASKKERPRVDGVPAHPTVKPVALMRWLARLVTQPGGKVLDLFAGTGTTGEACELEGFDSVLIEQDGNSVQLIDFRMSKYEVPEVA